MRALAIAWKDVRHVYRSFAGLAMMLVAPLLLAGAIGAAFGARGQLLRSGHQDRRGEPGRGRRRTAAITSALSPATSWPTCSTRHPAGHARGRARAAVDNGEAEVAVIIPAGAHPGPQLAQAAPSPGRDLQGPRPSPSARPSSRAVVQDLVQSLNGARAAASATAQLAVMQGITDSAKLAALAAADRPGLRPRRHRARRRASPSTRGRPVTPGGRRPQEPNTASQVLIGMMLFFTLFGAATPARSIIEEQRRAPSPPLHHPHARSVILGGKYIAVFLVVLLQTVILLVAGRLLFGAHWGAIGPVIVLTLCRRARGRVAGAARPSRSPRPPHRPGAGSAAIFVFLGLVSGSFIGGANVGGASSVVRHFSPLGWLIDGWNHTMFGGSWGGIWLPVVVALGFALVFFAVATFFFRRRYA